MRANRFYKEGIGYVKSEQYEEAESSFRRATRIYVNIKQYDNFGWSYMVSGNYEAAEEKFSEGIAAERLKAGLSEDVEMDYIKNLNIHIHLAMLYNILERFDKAEALYAAVVRENPKEYEYLRMQGENLIDWARKELTGRDEHYIGAYELFSTAYTDNPKNVDALFKMLLIEIMRGNDEAVDSLYNELTRRFPKAMDREVQTELAFHYLSRENFGPIMSILVRVLEKPSIVVFGTSEARDLYQPPVSPGEYRDYAEYFKEASIPKAYYAFAEYYKAVNNRKLQEEFLWDTINSEEARWVIEKEGVALVRRGEAIIAEKLPQHYPWEEKNRILLSDAYNDLGEIYARMETPGMAAEAIRNFKKSIEQNTRNVQAYFNLAQVYFYKERNYELARRNYERALSLNLLDRPGSQLQSWTHLLLQRGFLQSPIVLVRPFRGNSG